MANVTREQLINNELCIEWFDAVAAVKGCPGAPPAEAIERLIACGDALAAALAAPPPDDGLPSKDALVHTGEVLLKELRKCRAAQATPQDETQEPRPIRERIAALKAAQAPPPDQPGLAEQAVIALIDKAHDELSAMCQRQWGREAAIKWAIPARPGIDSDLIISEALSAARKVLAARQSDPGGPTIINEDDGDVTIDFDYANDRVVSIRLGAESCGLSAVVGGESYALPLDKVPATALALLRTEAKRTTIRQSKPPGLVSSVRELCGSFEHTLRHRHSQAHNGDVYAAGAYEVCRFCAPARDLIDHVRAALPATDPQEAR